jgi:hypothetical protein
MVGWCRGWALGELTDFAVTLEFCHRHRFSSFFHFSWTCLFFGRSLCFVLVKVEGGRHHSSKPLPLDFIKTPVDVGVAATLQMTPTHVYLFYSLESIL